MTTEADGRDFVFHTVASSEAEALKAFKRLHPRWRRPIEVVPPNFPSGKKKGAK